MSAKIKKTLFNNKKIFISVVFILLAPFWLNFLTLVLNSILNLGIYTGTFLRNLYNFIVC